MVVAALSVLVWLGGMWVMLEWILADASEVFLYVGVGLVGMSGLMVTAVILDRQQEFEQDSDIESSES